MRICFLDLDDTIIPTTWIRNRISLLRLANPSLTDNCLFKALRSELGEGFDEHVIKFLETVHQTNDLSVIVTNARSHLWLSTFKKMFPLIARKLAELKIDIVKTNPVQRDEPDGERNPMQYFNYWSDAKLLEFSRLLGEYSKGKCNGEYSLTCIGDNNFEHCAFIQLCDWYFPESAKMVKCTNGLRPEVFVKQLATMNDDMRKGTFRKLGLRRLSKYVQTATWRYNRATPSTSAESAPTPAELPFLIN